jgi:hypothetical protein
MAGALVSASTGVMESVLCMTSSMCEEGYWIPQERKRVEKE